MSNWVAYHGADSAEHQRRFDELAPQGFRMTALTVSGPSSNARYAAVWLQRPGPAWRAVHGLNAQQYQTAFDEAVQAGFAPVLISATGSSGDAIFAAAFEQGHSHGWFAHHGLAWGDDNTQGTFVNAMKRAQDQGFIPKSLCLYGSADDRRFAGVWHENTQKTVWSWWLGDPGFYQKIFEAETGGHMRPGLLDVADDGAVLAVFHDDWVGGWSARHNIDAAEYQREFDRSAEAGRFPMLLAAGGSGGDTRYATLFSDRQEPEPRAWRVTRRDRARASGLNALFRSFMAENGIRAGALCICRNGAPLVRRGYTWAESGYPATQPGSLFRFASLSKLFTAAAIDRLVQTDRLTLATAAYPLLGITAARLPGQTPDARTSGITIRQLIDHVSGLNQDIIGNLREAAAKLGLTRRLNKRDLVELVFGEPLKFPPGMPPAGESFVYLNFGYMMLAAIVEHVTGMRYIDFLRTEVLPQGASVFLGGTLRSELKPDEVTYDAPGAGLSIVEPARDLWLPTAYGGSYDLELVDGTGGMMASAQAVASFIATHAVWGIGGRAPGSTRFGAAPGDCSSAFSRGDGLDVCYMFNRWRNIDAFQAKVQAYLDTHPL
jgi:CubicO group peptidase (beta-lactamase class C family)